MPEKPHLEDDFCFLLPAFFFYLLPHPYAFSLLAVPGHLLLGRRATNNCYLAYSRSCPQNIWPDPYPAESVSSRPPFSPSTSDPPVVCSTARGSVNFVFPISISAPSFCPGWSLQSTSCPQISRMSVNLSENLRTAFSVCSIWAIPGYRHLEGGRGVEGLVYLWPSTSISRRHP